MESAVLAYYNRFMSGKKNRIRPAELNGISIYHEEKRTVYSPFFSKRAYIISENNVSYYVSYIQGYLIAILIFLIAYMLYRKPLLPILLTLAFLASNIFMFYRSFIAKANIIENYRKPKRDSFAARQADTMSEGNILTVIICSPLLAAAIMFNSHLNHYEGGMFYLMLAISAVTLAYGLLHIYVLYLKKSSKKEG